jgi:hypothetical protein
MTALDQALLSGAVALVVSVIGNFIWSGVIKPRLERKNLARVFAEEVSLTTDMIAAQATSWLRHKKDAALYPLVFILPTPCFDSLASRLAELKEVRDLLRYYTRVKAVAEAGAQLHQLGKVHDENFGKMETAKAASYEERLTGLRQMYLVNAKWAVEDQETLLPRLLDSARSRVWPFGKRPNITLRKASEIWGPEPPASKKLASPV